MLLVLIIARVERMRILIRRRIDGIARLLDRGMGIVWGRPRHDGRVCRKSGGEDLVSVATTTGDDRDRAEGGESEGITMNKRGPWERPTDMRDFESI